MNKEKREQDYMDGWNDGKADKPPNPDRLAYGANSCNQYERGYIDSGKEDR